MRAMLSADDIARPDAATLGGRTLSADNMPVLGAWGWGASSGPPPLGIQSICLVDCEAEIIGVVLG